MKTNQNNHSGVVEDIWVDTQSDNVDYDAPANSEQDDDTTLLNPDPVSMESRG